jgi:Spy/CpxP family protein refolding chaperone
MESTAKIWQRVLVAGCLLVGFASLSAGAEDTKPPEKPATPPTATGANSRPDPAQILKMQRERLDQLNLTDDQKKKLDDLFATAADDLKKVDAGDRQAMGKVMGDLREKIAGILTDEQKAKRAQAGPGGPGGPRGNPADRLQAALDKADLSSDQKEKTKPIIEVVRKKFEELRSQIQGGDRAAIREKIKTLMDDTRDKLKDILTPEQAEKVKAALEAGRPPGAPGGRPARPATENPPKPEEKPADK